MQSSPQTASITEAASGPVKSRLTEDRTYQFVTVAAILLVLGSLWLF